MKNSLEHPIYGTTLYLGETPVKTRYGVFTSYTFQNLIHKGHIVALAYGNLKNEVLYTRVHSSCVTSETLRALDCDCVKQLDGAFKKIAEVGHGILFYLIQEGRGCGYVGKSRACMMVQYHDDKITTFDAYNTLGMKHDYRDYRNIAEIAHILEIQNANFVLLSNNPDKINSLQDMGIKVVKVESIEYPPGPFNQSYLVSKAQTGHLLYQTKEKVAKYHFPHQRVRPFTPYSLAEATRFVHCATYSIPICPVNNCMVFHQQELNKIKVPYEIVEKIDEHRFFLKFQREDLDKIEIHPYWFRVYMYYDLASNSDFVVLTYGDVDNKTPLVRIHSESIFNRFPLQETIYRKKYTKSLEKIVRNDSGIIVLLYHDGRGAGLGNYILNQMDSSAPTGVKADTRDFHAVSLLLKHHLRFSQIRVLYSESSRESLQAELDHQQLHVLEWIDLDKKDEGKGHQIILKKIKEAPGHFFSLQVPKQVAQLSSEVPLYLSGLGSSMAQAEYAHYLLQEHHPLINVRLLPISMIKSVVKNLSVPARLYFFSQGLSPQAWSAIGQWPLAQLTLITSVTEQNPNKEKAAFIKKILSAGGEVIHFPQEDEYETLIRIIGPLCGIEVAKELFSPPANPRARKEKFLRIWNQCELKLPPEIYFHGLKLDRQVVILCSSPLTTLFHNVVLKLEEGAFLSSVRLVDYLEFSHGPFQNVEYQYYQRGKTTHFILIQSKSEDKVLIDRAKKMLEGKYPIWVMNSELDLEDQIFEYEMIFNHFILRWMELTQIDQISWFGKQEQYHLYESF